MLFDDGNPDGLTGVSATHPFPVTAQMTDATSTQTATIAINASLSSAFDMGGYLNGSMLILDGWTAANAVLKVCSTIDGDFFYARDSYGNKCVISGILTDESSPYEIPSFGMTHRYGKISSESAAGVAVTQDTAQTLEISLK